MPGAQQETGAPPAASPAAGGPGWFFRPRPLLLCAALFLTGNERIEIHCKIAERVDKHKEGGGWNAGVEQLFRQLENRSGVIGPHHQVPAVLQEQEKEDNGQTIDQQAQNRLVFRLGSDFIFQPIELKVRTLPPEGDGAEKHQIGEGQLHNFIKPAAGKQSHVPGEYIRQQQDEENQQHENRDPLQKKACPGIQGPHDSQSSQCFHYDIPSIINPANPATAAATAR